MLPDNDTTQIRRENKKKGRVNYHDFIFHVVLHHYNASRFKYFFFFDFIDYLWRITLISRQRGLGVSII